MAERAANVEQILIHEAGSLATQNIPDLAYVGILTALRLGTYDFRTGSHEGVAAALLHDIKMSDGKKLSLLAQAKESDAGKLSTIAGERLRRVQPFAALEAKIMSISQHKGAERYRRLAKQLEQQS